MASIVSILASVAGIVAAILWFAKALKGTPEQAKEDIDAKIDAEEKASMKSGRPSE